MPSESKSQQRLFQAAEHGADFPMARKVRGSMSASDLHDFAAGSMAGKPEHASAHGKKKHASAKDSVQHLKARLHHGKK